MSSDSDRGVRLRHLLPRSVRTLPADLAAVVGLVAVTFAAVLTPGLNETPLRVVVGLPFVLFVPGYAFVAALFPERGDLGDGASEAGDGSDSPPRLSRVREGGGIDGIERVALSFGTSIAVVPLLGLVLNFTPWGIRLVPVLVAVGGFTVAATVVAASRRRALPSEERFVVPYDRWLAGAREELFAPESRTDAALNALLVVSVLLAAASVTYAVAVPKQGEAFTEFYLLTENETGDLVADDYPTEFAPGESKSVYVGIGNHEHERVEYGVVVTLQRVTVGNNTTRVRERRELRRLRTAVGANETWRRQVNLTPTMQGERLRLAFLLYRDGIPPRPTVENAYRELHLWVNVSAESTVSQRRRP